MHVTSCMCSVTANPSCVCIAFICHAECIINRLSKFVYFSLFFVSSFLSHHFSSCDYWVALTLHMHIHIRVHAHTCTYTHTHTCTYTHTHTNTHTHRKPYASQALCSNWFLSLRAVSWSNEGGRRNRRRRRRGGRRRRRKCSFFWRKRGQMGKKESEAEQSACKFWCAAKLSVRAREREKARQSFFEHISTLYIYIYICHTRMLAYISNFYKYTSHTHASIYTHVFYTSLHRVAKMHRMPSVASLLSQKSH